MTLVKKDCQYTESHTVIFSASNYKTMHFEKFGEERARDIETKVMPDCVGSKDPNSEESKKGHGQNRDKHGQK